MQRKSEILSKYDGKTSDALLNYLKRNYPVKEFYVSWTDVPIKQILIEDRLFTLKYNKKYLVGKLYHEVEDGWMHLPESDIRRTIKKYIDGYLL